VYPSVGAIYDARLNHDHWNAIPPAKIEGQAFPFEFGVGIRVSSWRLTPAFIKVTLGRKVVHHHAAEVNDASPHAAGCFDDAARTLNLSGASMRVAASGSLGTIEEDCATFRCGADAGAVQNVPSPHFNRESSQPSGSNSPGQHPHVGPVFNNEAFGKAPA
jgi:hypothetical protein